MSDGSRGMPAATSPGKNLVRFLVAAGALVVVGGGAFAAWRLTSSPVKPIQRTAGRETANAPAPPPPERQTTSAPVTPTDQNLATSRRTDTARANKPAAKPPVVATAPHQAPTSAQPVAQKAPAGTTASSTPSISTGLPQRDTKPIEVAPQPTPPVVSDKARNDAAAEAEVAHIRETVESYVRAIGAKRLETLQQLFPSMSSQTRSGYEALFNNVSDLSTQLAGSPTVTPHGTTADAEFAYDMRYRDPSRGNVNQHFTIGAKLQRTEQGWIILSLGAVK